MNNNDYDEYVGILLEKARKIERAKRPAYTFGNNDVLKNFKSVSDRLQLTPLQVWAVYAMKHMDAIASFAADEDIPQAEEITGRFADLLNYLKLGYALAIETKRINIPQEEESNE